MDKKVFRVLLKHCFLMGENTVEAKQWLHKRYGDSAAGKSDQKQQRVEDSERFLELFKRGKKDFLRRYVTMDETCIHQYTPETERSSAEWTAAGESRPKRPKTQQWAGKVMASIFCDAHGILFIDYLEKGKTINSDY